MSREFDVVRLGGGVTEEAIAGGLSRLRLSNASWSVASARTGAAYVCSQCVRGSVGRDERRSHFRRRFDRISFRDYWLANPPTSALSKFLP